MLFIKYQKTKPPVSWYRPGIHTHSALATQMLSLTMAIVEVWATLELLLFNGLFDHKDSVSQHVTGVVLVKSDVYL